MSASYSLNGAEYDGPGFLRALAEDLYTTPGGWGGVIEDLKDLAKELESEAPAPRKGEWESVYSDRNEQLERIKIPNGWLYRSTQWRTDSDGIIRHLTSSLSTVYNQPFKVKT
jgi:hypothetical protein